MADRLNLEEEVTEMFRAKMREFVSFCRESWQLSEEEFAELHPDKGAEYREGYNAAIADGIEGAFELWGEEERFT